MALQGSSYDDFSEPKKPQRPENHRMELFLIVVLGALIAVIVLPSLRSRAMRAFTVRTQEKIAQDARVWANKGAGYYYCNGSRFYGHGPGSFMKQGDALTLGYQPELGKYCSESDQADSTNANRKKDIDAHAGHAVAPSAEAESSHAPAERSQRK